MSDQVKLNIKPIPINPRVDCGSDTVYVFEVHDQRDIPIDLEGYSARMQLRPYPGAKKLYDELNTDDGRLEIVRGGIKVYFPADITEGYKFDSAAYDLVITSDDGYVYRVAEGEVLFNSGVTLR